MEGRIYFIIVHQNCKRCRTHYIVGDLDSIEPHVQQYFKIKDQDTSDLTKTLNLVESIQKDHKRDFDDVSILGGLGGGFTHEMANINSLFLTSLHQCCLISSDTLLKFGEIVSTSNEIQSNNVLIQASHPLLFTIDFRLN